MDNVKDIRAIYSWCKKISAGNYTSGVHLKGIDGGNGFYIITEEEYNKLNNSERLARHAKDLQKEVDKLNNKLKTLKNIL